MAEYLAAISVVADLVSRLGVQLERDLFGSSPSDPSESVVSSTSNESSIVRVRRAHYGSSLVFDMVELLPHIVEDTVLVSTGIAAYPMNKNGRQMLSLFLTLASPQERNLWWEGRKEAQRSALESRRVTATHHGLQRFKDEITIATLKMNPAGQDEYESRIEQMNDPQNRIGFRSALSSMMTLLERVGKACGVFRVTIPGCRSSIES